MASVFAAYVARSRLMVLRHRLYAASDGVHMPERYNQIERAIARLTLRMTRGTLGSVKMEEVQ